MEECIHVVFLVPDLHDLQTGGNVYNRRMVGALRPETSVQVRSWDPEESPAPAFELPDEGVIVADSLLARHPGAIRTVQAAHPTATVVLLVHYLRCIDPTAADPEASAAERDALGAIDGAVTTSRFVRQALVDDGVPPEQAVVVPPGLDERYRGPRPARSARPVPRMLTVANLLPEKGLRSFVDVLRDLRSVPWRWTLVGSATLDPDYAEDVHRRIRAAGLSRRVTLTGSVSPEVLCRMYNRADLFVLPSRFETRSLSMREAMARGLPVVGYRVGGVAENVGDASVGHLVPSGEAGALRSALHALLVDPMARRHKGRAAWRWSRTFPTWAEAAERFRDALSTLHACAADGE